MSKAKGRKPPALSKLSVTPRANPSDLLISTSAVTPQQSHNWSAARPTSIDDDLAELELLRLDVDSNLKLRPIPMSPSPSQFFTPAVAYFNEASHPLPITAQALFSRMMCSPHPVLLDVRSADSFNAFRLKGAINVAVPVVEDQSILESSAFREMSDFNHFIPSASGQGELEDLLRQGAWDGDAIVYDDERQLVDESSTWLVMEYLLPLVKGQVWYLEGGMSAISTLPHFELVVVTAEFSQTTSVPNPQPRKRSVPNLRKLDTSSMEPLPKQSNPVSDTLLAPPSPRQRVGSGASLSARRTNSPSRIDISSSAPVTPRASAASLTPRALQDEPGQKFVLSTILPNFLYLGPELSNREHVASLKAASIRRILNVATECDDDLGLNLRGQFERYHRIPLKDNVEAENVGKYLREACDFLDDARLHDAPTYVHCKAGKSRSVMAVIGYLIHSHYWTLSRAYAFVLERREGISPNIGFVSELMSFEESELGGKFGGPTSAVADRGDESYHHALSGKRPGHVRESLPPLLSFTRTESEPHPNHENTRLVFADGEAARETEVRDAWGRYRHQRRAPVDETTLQPLRRVSKAGLESSIIP